MTAKEYLWQIKNTSKKILALNCELEEIKTEKEGLSSITISDKVKTSSVYHSNLDDLILQEEEILKERRQVRAEWWKCRQMIKQIKNSDQSDTIRYYYLLNYDNWAEVAKKIHISERSVYSIHGEALEAFRKISGLE